MAKLIREFVQTELIVNLTCTAGYVRCSVSRQTFRAFFIQRNRNYRPFPSPEFKHF